MKEVLKKYKEGNCTAEEFEKALRILKHEGDSSSLNNFMQRHWEELSLKQQEALEAKFEAILHQVHHQINLKERSPNFFKRMYSVAGKVAAVLILPLALGLVYLINEINVEDSEIYTSLSVPDGVHSQLNLPDGSKVWLNSGSEIRFPASFKGREVRNIELQGEAYFEVKTNKRKPLIVNTGKIAVEVLGTSFNICAYNNDPDVQVALVEGRVQLVNFVDKEKSVLAHMKPYQVAKYIKSKNEITVSTEDDLSHIVAWKENKLVYVNESFDSVFRRMSRRYSVEYEIVHERVLEYRITATFIHETLEDFLKLLSISSPIEYEIIPGKKKPDGSFGKRKVIIKERSKRKQR